MEILKSYVKITAFTLGGYYLLAILYGFSYMNLLYLNPYYWEVSFRIFISLHLLVCWVIRSVILLMKGE